MYGIIVLMVFDYLDAVIFKQFILSLVNFYTNMAMYISFCYSQNSLIIKEENCTLDNLFC